MVNEKLKATIIKHYLNTPHTIVQTADIFGVSERTLKGWLSDQGLSKKPPSEYMNLEDYHQHVHCLLLDIETLPLIAAVYSLKTNYISPAQVVQYGMIASFQYQFNGGETMNVNLRDLGLIPERGLIQPHHARRLVQIMSDIVSTAHYVVGHNGKKFDIGRLYAYMVEAGVRPKLRPKIFDTLSAARRIGLFDSNSLDGLCDYLGIGRKVQGGMGGRTGLLCLAGCEETWERVIGYGDNDVDLLEELYLRVRPHSIGNLHPNVAHYFADNKPRCVVCGHAGVKWGKELNYTQVQGYNTVVCQKPRCGHVMQERTTALSKEKRGAILKSCT